MRKRILLLIAMFALLLPFTVNAAKSNEGYKVMDLKETFDEEGIEIADSNYKETDKQVVIYMFRGNGCGYCRAFLNYINSILPEKGKMFKLRTFEVWYDKNNYNYMQAVAKDLDATVGGVPFMVIGNKYFSGYGTSMNQTIVDTILEQKNNEKYVDIGAKHSNLAGTTTTTTKTTTTSPVKVVTNKNESRGFSNLTILVIVVVIVMVIFVILACICVIIVVVVASSKNKTK